jgi:hypothetical protein
MKIQKIFLALVLTGIAWSASAADITGRWAGGFDSQIGHQNYTFNFESKGDKLTATADAVSDDGKRQVVFTEVKQTADTISFVEMRKIQDNDIRIEYTGKIATNEMGGTATAIQFTRKVGDFGSQEFKAVRFVSDLPGVGHLFSPSGTDISGVWRAEFDTQIGKQKYVYTLHVTGNKVTGKANAEIDGQKRETELQEGKVADGTVTFVEMLKFQDNDIRIEYTGKIRGFEISFTRKVADFATEEFVAKRDAEAPPSLPTTTNPTNSTP